MFGSDVAVMFGPNSTQWQSSSPTLFLRSKVSAGRILAPAAGGWRVRSQTNGIKGELSSLIHSGTSYFRRCELSLQSPLFSTLGFNKICVNLRLNGPLQTDHDLIL